MFNIAFENAQGPFLFATDPSTSNRFVFCFVCVCVCVCVALVLPWIYQWPTLCWCVNIFWIFFVNVQGNSTRLHLKAHVHPIGIARVCYCLQALLLFSCVIWLVYQNIPAGEVLAYSKQIRLGKSDWLISFQSLWFILISAPTWNIYSPKRLSSLCSFVQNSRWTKVKGLVRFSVFVPLSDAAEKSNSYSRQPSTLNSFCPKILILLLYKINSNLKGSFWLLLKLTWKEINSAGLHVSSVNIAFKIIAPIRSIVLSWNYFCLWWYSNYAINESAAYYANEYFNLFACANRKKRGNAT